LSVAVCSKKIDGLQLKQDDIQFLVQEAKQQILKYYKNQNIIHIVINNYKITLSGRERNAKKTDKNA
jgi:cell division protein FtsA